jgi:hypothetical protein
MPAFFIRAFGTANKKAGIFLFPVMGRNVDKAINNRQSAIGKL